MKNIILAIIVVINVLCCQGVLAEPLLVKVIQLQHVRADVVLPLVKPILDETSSVSGQDNTLVIKATANYMQVIEQVIAQLDKAPQKFLITLRYGAPQTLQVIAGTKTRDDQFVRSLQTLDGKPGLISFSRQARIMTSGASQNINSSSNNQQSFIDTASKQRDIVKGYSSDIKVVGKIKERNEAQFSDNSDDGYTQGYTTDNGPQGMAFQGNQHRTITGNIKENVKADSIDMKDNSHTISNVNSNSNNQQSFIDTASKHRGTVKGYSSDTNVVGKIKERNEVQLSGDLDGSPTQGYTTDNGPQGMAFQGNQHRTFTGSSTESIKADSIDMKDDSHTTSNVNSQTNMLNSTSQQGEFDYKDVDSGLMVTASLLNDGQVKVQLRQQHAQFSRDGQQNVVAEQLQTELIVSPGQWVSVKHGNDTAADQQQTISTQSKVPQQDDLYIKVELVK